MTAEDSSDRNDRRARVGWWAAWLAILALASAIPYLHWKNDVAGIIEPLRYPWDLLPAHWLFFRWAGEIATYALVFVVLAGIWAWRQPKQRSAVTILAAIVALVASVASAMLGSRLMIVFIHKEAERTAEERLRMNMDLGPSPENTQSDNKQ